jgi:RNA polymerase sigma factor (sigma-70 family)
MVSTKASEDASDGELLARFVAHREEAAFVALLHRHGPMVLHVCHRIQGNEHDAEDAFQATFLLFARKAGSIRKAESVAGWLYAVARRLARAARDQRARRQARERRAADMRKTPGTPEKGWQELEATLHEALAQVPETYRAPLLLCYLQGKTQEEAARQLGCPLGTVRSRLARGRGRLKQVLQRRGVRLSAAALAVALAGSSATAAVRPALLQATARASLAYAADQPAAALVSARAAALLEGGLQAMRTAKLKTATAVVLAVGALSLGAGALGTHALADPDRASAQAASASPQGAAGQEDRHGTTVRGHVLDSDGQPLAGAKLLVPRWGQAEPIPGQKIPMELVGTTADDGRFSITLSAPAPHRRSYLIAHAAGRGVDWIDLGEGKPPGDVTLRLPKDVPITGQVVNTEGKPVAGVSVSAAAIYVPANDNLDAYLAGWLRDLRDNLATPRKRLYVPLDGITGTVVTDRDGRFTLHGAGAERIVHVTFSGGGVARSTPYVITRPGFDPKPYNDVFHRKEHEDLRLNRFLGLYAPSLTFVVEPGKTVEGIVKDAATGKPLAGCRLSALVGFGKQAVAVSGADGSYRLEGLPKSARGYGVYVSPPAGTAYLRRTANAGDTAGYTPVKLDVGLAQGVVVTGRVADRKTGKGLQAGIRFAPLPDNTYFGSRPGFDNYRYDGTTESTGKDGRFRLITIPGKALVMAQVHEGEKFHGEYVSPYRRAVPDPDHKGLFHYDRDNDTWVVTTAAGLEFTSTENVVKVIDVRPGGETTVELLVDRGVTGRVTVQDADGKPLAGAWLAGLTDGWPITHRLPEPTETVFALDPARPRQLVVYHPEKQLGGTAVIRGDEKEPAVVKLGPVGTVTGRLREADGTPLAGAEVSVNARTRVARKLYRFARPSGKPAVTDPDGRFTLTGVVPGVSFSVQVRKGEQYFRSKPNPGPLKLKPGESRDLGNRTVELLQYLGPARPRGAASRAGRRRKKLRRRDPWGD